MNLNYEIGPILNYIVYMSRYYILFKKLVVRICNVKFTIFFFTFLLFCTNFIAQNIPDIIFTQIPQKKSVTDPLETNIYTPSKLYIEGCRIVSLLSNKKKPTNLTPEFYSASDPDISFDSKHIIFAGKKEVKDYWQIWKMRADGSEKIQITKGSGDCFMPVYAGNRFYLNDETPTPQIIYVSTAHKWNNNIEAGLVYSLYGTDTVGSITHRLTFNLYSDFSPDVLANGRIVFSSIQQSDDLISSSSNMAFFSINNDGTDLMPYYGNHEGPKYKNDIHFSNRNHDTYFIESDKSNLFGGGNIAFLSQRRPLNSYKLLSQNSDGYYKNPNSMPNGDLIVSFQSNEPDDVYRLCRFNITTRKREATIIKSSGWHCLDAQLIVHHPKPQGRSNWLIPGADNGVFYCLNSYQSSFFQNKEINLGDYKFVRIIEGLPLHNDNTKIYSAHKPMLLTQFAPARIIGVAPVEKDGSFNVRVPAETPISFQMLDENQMTISKQKSWTWVIGNENRGCIGCHENRELSPSNTLVDAITKPPVDLNTINRERKSVDYQNQIAPVIVSKCATSECHVAGKATPNLSHSNNMDTYKTLIEPIRGREKEYYIKPGYAKSSPLIWHLLGKRLDSDNNVYSSAITQMPPEYPLTDEDKLVFIEWVDLGAQWTLSNYVDVKSEINSN